MRGDLPRGCDQQSVSCIQTILGVPLRRDTLFFYMFTSRQIIAIILVGLILIVLIQNSYAVRLKFLFTYVSLPLSILVLAVLLIGVLIGYWLNRKKSHGSKR